MNLIETAKLFCRGYRFPFMKVTFTLIAWILFGGKGFAQTDSTGNLKASVSNKEASLAGATMILINQKDSQVVKIQLTDTTGTTLFSKIIPGNYLLKASHVGFNNFTTANSFSVHPGETYVLAVRMDSVAGYLKEVSVQGRKPFIQLENNRTIVNMEASLTNIGTSVLEALEKLPGITIDRNGGIALKGKSGVLILVDGKQTYLAGTDLSNYLGALSSDQVSEIEIIEHSSAKYDAQGNGVINIKTKKSTRRGVFGSITSTYAQGRFPKNSNSFVFNVHKGAANFFLNYNFNQSGTYTFLYAYRKYLEPDNTTVHSILVQDFYDVTTGYSHSVRTGLDYTLSSTATIGITLNGILVSRPTHGRSNATWQNAQSVVDSSSNTALGYFIDFKNAGASANFHKEFSKKTELNIDADLIGYKVGNTSSFENTDPSGNVAQTYLGNMPGKLTIISAKADFTKKINDNISWEAGWKSSHTSNDNLAAYTFNDGSGFTDDLAKSNHFLYKENNHAFYADGKIKNKKWSIDGGLRYEFTNYRGRQLGNAVVKDTVFIKNYSSLFPNAMVTYTIDSSNELSINVDRKIDRPPFQKLNPFVFIINKYTYQTGNPGFLPAFTWSASISHNYKGIFVSTLSFSTTSNYFSQLFYSNPDGLVIYTEGNIGSATDAGASISLQLNPFKWWNLTTGISVDDKTISGTVVNHLHANIVQSTLNINNQFHFAKNWTAEISGSYTSKSQVDIQEILDPAGQLAAAVSKLVLKNKLNIKAGVRDLFHTQLLKGLTQFQQSNEYFKEVYDSRMVTLSLSYHFGKVLKSNHRTERAAEEEIQRAGNG